MFNNYKFAFTSVFLNYGKHEKHENFISLKIRSISWHLSLAMAKFKQAWLCSSGLTKRFVDMYVCTNVRKYIIKTFGFFVFP